jgi:hypothetical protein
MQYGGMRGIIHTLHAIDQGDIMFLRIHRTEIHHDSNYLLGLIIWYFYAECRKGAWKAIYL